MVTMSRMFWTLCGFHHLFPDHCELDLGWGWGTQNRTRQLSLPAMCSRLLKIATILEIENKGTCIIPFYFPTLEFVL